MCCLVIQLFPLAERQCDWHPFRLVRMPGVIFSCPSVFESRCPSIKADSLFARRYRPNAQNHHFVEQCSVWQFYWSCLIQSVGFPAVHKFSRLKGTCLRLSTRLSQTWARHPQNFPPRKPPRLGRGEADDVPHAGWLRPLPGA